MRRNLTKEKVKAGQPAFGVLLKIPSPAIIKLCGYVGFDFALIDVEEGPSDDATCEDLDSAAGAMGITSLVRVLTVDAKVAWCFLDIRAMGVQIPNVTSKEEGLRAVRYGKYRPDGSQGIGAVKAADYGVTHLLGHYVMEANREIMIIAMIEDVKGVRNLAEIHSVQDVEVICVGPSDPSPTLGLPGRAGHTRVRGTVDRIIAAVLRPGKALGFPVWACARPGGI
jgi:2-keto-3-deoxy-L-rhamnonate aldolase RhmA